MDVPAIVGVEIFKRLDIYPPLIVGVASTEKLEMYSYGAMRRHE